MRNQTIKVFHVIGIAVRTTNENNKAAQDIGALWTKFMSENIAKQIPGKISHTIYSIYTEYEKDHTKPYTTILGCRVENIEHIPDGMVGITIAEGQYAHFLAKGNLMQGAVYQAWENIWQSDIDRAFTTDFEVYGEKAQNPEAAEVDIFIALKA